MSTWWYASKEQNFSWWIKNTKQYFVVRGEHYVIRLKFSSKRHMSGSVATLVNFSASCQNLFGFNLAVVERVLRGSTKKIKMDVLIFPYDGSHAEVFWTHYPFGFPAKRESIGDWLFSTSSQWDLFFLRSFWKKESFISDSLGLIVVIFATQALNYGFIACHRGVSQS